jgi:23S rRNA (guanosine2251-2'-O)-methyltransferase
MKRESRSTSKASVLYGLNPVIEALRSNRALQEIVLAEGARDHRLRELIKLARQRKVPLNRAPRVALDKASANGNHQGVIARASAARYQDPNELLNFIAAQIGSKTEPLVVLLDGLEDPRNFGAILRTAECAAVQAIFIAERRAVGLTEVVAKTSAGAIEYVPVARVTNLNRLIDQLKERNVWVVGATADAAMLHTEWDWTRASAIVLGGEGSGLHRLVREHCDALVRIPVLGKIESLNVAVAAGVLFYEAMRQRTLAKKGGR